MHDKRPAHDSSKPVIRLVGLDDEFQGREWSFDDDFHVGRVLREPTTGLTLDAPSAKSVSSFHATVSHDEIGWWVTDRKSTNGTFLNGTRIGTEPVGPLRVGDVVQFARIALRVECASGSTERRRGDEDSDLWAGLVLGRALTNAIDLVRREAVLTRCGCARRFAHLFQPEHLATVERAERTADGVESAPSPQPVGSDPLTALVNALTEDRHDLGQWLTLVEGDLEAQAAEWTAQQAIQRDVLEGPCQPNWFDAAWRTSDVVGLAKCMYESGDFSAIPILADALQDAGCENTAVLEHCRADTPHVRGCWVVDEVLGHRSEEARFRQFGMIDPLTGAGNRRACSLVLRRLVLSQASLLAVEIDSFAQFRETHSSPVGDRVIVEISRLLGDALDGGGLLTRTSGDGFRIILQTNERHAALAVGEQFRRAVESWRWAGAEGEAEHAFTISVGVATCGQASVTRNTDSEARRLHGELKADTRESLRRAKAYGGNRVCTRKRDD